MNKQDRISIPADLDLSQIIDRLNAEQDSIITLEILPGGILYSGFGLRMLQSHFPQKKFQIVTTDPIMKRLAEQVGIRTYSRADSIEFEQEYSKTHILRHNFSFFEYFWYEIQKFVSRLHFSFQKKKSSGLKYKKGSSIETNLILLIVGLILSISLLFFIFYFAVSKTYVTITPDFAIKTVSQNFIYTETDSQSVLDSRPIVPIKRVEKTIVLDETYNIATYDVNSVRASKGQVQVFNELPNEQVFRPNTRFVTEDGLVFRSQEWIKVPATKTASGEVVIGSAYSVLVADGYDTKGELIWEKGNIPEGTILDIPGLKFNRDKIYAKTLSAFVGGQNPTVKVLTDVELAKFNSLLVDSLKTQALAGLNADLSLQNTGVNQDYRVLDIPDNIKFTDPKIEILDAAKVGDKRPDIHLKGSITVSAYIYDRNLVLGLLKNLLTDRLLYGTERLHDILPETLKITTIIGRTDAPKMSLKGTTELSATISYNFEDDANAQTRRLKNLIAGKTVDQAVSILLNDQSIAKAQIRLSPFWLTRVSGNVDSIDFIIDK